MIYIVIQTSPNSTTNYLFCSSPAHSSPLLFSLLVFFTARPRPARDAPSNPHHFAPRSSHLDCVILPVDPGVVPYAHAVMRQLFGTRIATLQHWDSAPRLPARNTGERGAVGAPAALAQRRLVLRQQPQPAPAWEAPGKRKLPARACQAYPSTLCAFFSEVQSCIVC